MLCTPGLLPKVVSCEVNNLPPKWSDHAALLLGKRCTAACSHHPADPAVCTPRRPAIAMQSKLLASSAADACLHRL